MKNCNSKLKIPTVILSIFLGLFCFAKISQAATYYVSTSGSDSSPGTQSQPWAHCPGMAGWTGSVTINNGDTVYFKNSETWTAGSGWHFLELRAAKNVNGGTFDGSTWGSGTRAKFLATGNFAASGLMVHIGVSNITFTGFEIDGNAPTYNNGGIATNWPSADGNISNIAISNNIVHNIANTDSYRYGINIGTLSGYTVTNVTVLNNVVYNCGHEGMVVYANNEDVGNKITNVLVRGNEVYNTGLYNSSYGTGLLIKNWIDGIVVEWNYYHNNIRVGMGTEMQVKDRHTPKNVVIRYNIIKDNTAYGVYFLGNEEAYPLDWPNVELYGNLIIGNGKSSQSEGIQIFWAGNTYGHGTASYKVYNNTVSGVGNAAIGTKYVIAVESASGNPTIELKNNIFISNGHPVLSKNSTSIIHVNNLYWRTSGDNLVVYDNGTTYNRSAVKTWEPTAQNTDPLFKSISNLPTGFTGIYGTSLVPNTDGLSISTGSNAIDKGANLDTACSGAINLSGAGTLVRPQGAGWDIGAYEYQEALPDTTPPAAPSGVTID